MAVKLDDSSDFTFQGVKIRLSLPKTNIMGAPGISKNYSEWINELQLKFEPLGENLVLFDNIKQILYNDYPTKQGQATMCFLTKGKIDVGINLRRHTFEAPCIFFSDPGQIVQYFHASDDTSLAIIAISQQFAQNLQLNFRQLLPMFFFLKDNHQIPLKDDELALLTDYYYLLRKTINYGDKLFRVESARHLMEALLFTINNIVQPHIISVNSNKSRQETIFEEFVRLIPQYFIEERSLEFYAGKLSLTPKHLSEVIKKVSKRSANAWIDELVCLEAKALLKSSNMTIQQVSNELNFPSQSFFGKYFKRVVGISPKEYRNR